MRGEKIYQYDLDVTGITEFGASFEAVMSGEVVPPPQGLRFDVAFAGRASGRLSGRVQGVDYLRMRADGRTDLDIHAVIETDGGQRIALRADGVATPRQGEPIADLFENVALSTAFGDCAWVNSRQVWGVGTVDFAEGKIHIDAYMQ